MFKTFADPLTGRIITKLSPDNVLCHHPYFYNRMFSRDSRFLLYAKQDVNAARTINMLDLQTGETRLLAGSGKPGELPVSDFSPNFSADEKSVFYNRESRIIKLNLRSGSEEIIYESEPEWSGYSTPSLSSDDRFIITIELFKKDHVRDTGNWDTFEPQWRMNPRCRLVLVDVENKSSKVIHEEKLWLGHPQFRPHHNSDISFCHEGPATLIDARLWFINADGSGVRCLHKQSRNEI
ncbi:MAG: oligogalacturonate lyase family protein, partial [Treponema sp.]|nr:oligogalacturonate lyase family protein [Treponema sp.]